MADDDLIWFLHESGEPVGPITADDLRRRIQKLGFADSTYVWRQGFDDWKPASEVPELQGLRPPPFKHQLTKATILEEVKAPISIAAVEHQPPRGFWKKVTRVALAILGFIVILFAATIGKEIGRAAFAPAKLSEAQLAEQRSAVIREGFSQAVIDQRPKLPMKVDELTTMTGISSEGAVLTYIYTVIGDGAYDSAELKKSVVSRVCGSAAMKKTVEAGAIYRYRWLNMSSKPLGFAEIKNGDCG